MRKKSDIVRYSTQQLEAMRRRGEDRTDWRKVDATTEDELEASIIADPDDVHQAVDWSRAIRGLPPGVARSEVPIDSEVLAWFKLAGDDYHSRINAVLRAYVKRQKAALRRARAG